MSGIAELLEQIREQRRTTHIRLSKVTEDQMLAKTQYGEREVEARFMFYRLIAHQVEHTVHLAKTLHALGIVQGEAEMILKNLQAASGELEGMLIGLNEDDLDRVPSEEDWPVRRVVEHILEAEESYGRRIVEAIADKSG